MKKVKNKETKNKEIKKAEVKDKYIWSKYQEDIFQDVSNGTGHTAIIARAGSGKTTVLTESINRVPENKSIVAVAFNQDIYKELKEKITRTNAQAYTLHSLGYKAILSNNKDTVFDNNKCKSLVETIIGSGYEKYDLNFAICKATSLAKGCLMETPAQILDLIDDFDIDTMDCSPTVFVGYVIQTLEKCKKQRNIVDYDDMIWFPLVHNLKIETFDYVFIDEAQDLNKAQIELALKSCNPDGRIFAFGDPYQSLYMWRGADENAIDNIVAKLNAKRLPLSITYRCPKKVVDLAKEIVTDYEAAPNAPEGKLEEINIKEMLTLVKPGDFILSRTNAPLIGHCMSLLKNGVSANIAGKDIGTNLLAFVRKSKAKSIDGLLKYVESWKVREIKRLTGERKEVSSITDKAECIEALCDGCESLQDLKKVIGNLFESKDDSKKVILSTTHKAKGLERDRVFMLSGTYRKGFNYAENCCWYVAVTRAKQELYLVKKEKKKSVKEA